MLCKNCHMFDLDEESGQIYCNRCKKHNDDAKESKIKQLIKKIKQKFGIYRHNEDEELFNQW